MRLTHPRGDYSVVACTILALAACSGVESNAPKRDAQRVPAILQLESSTPLASAIHERARDSTVSWTPPIGDEYARLFVPATVIEVRDTVRVGEVVQVVVNSIGENGCWHADGGALTQRGDTAVVTAYDRHSGAAVCTQLWTDRLRHSFTTAFPRAGVGVVRAHGRRVKAGSPSVVSPIVATRTVVVIP